MRSDCSMYSVTRRIGVNEDPKNVQIDINADLNNEFDVIVVGKKGDMTVTVSSIGGTELTEDDLENINNCISQHYNH